MAITALPPSSRIVLVAPGLAAGGTERVVSLMANWWAAAGHRVTVVTLDGPESPPFFPIDARVALVRLDVAAVTRGPLDALLGNVRRVRALRSALATRPGFLISFIDVTNVLVLIATLDCRRPVVAAERTDPSMAPLPRAWRRLRALLYRRAACVVVQTARVKALVEASLACRALVIPNPVKSLTSHEAVPYDRAPDFIGVGRFTREKGFDLLIRAFARVAASDPAPRLRLVGDGPLRRDLQALAVAIGVDRRIDWLGQRTDVGDILGRGDIYVLASRFEGFPNVLCEAMVAGAPVVACDCPSGPGDIVTHGVDGLLVPPEDVAGLATAMSTLLASPAERRRLGTRARDLAARLSLEPVMAAWERALTGNLGSSRPHFR